MTATDQYFLSKGKHTNPQDGKCAMEWVAYLAGEPHTDTPVCVSPVLTRFCIAFNDRLPDAERQKLRPYLARTIGTVGDGRDSERIRMCVEFLYDTAFPTLLGHDEIALGQLRELPTALVIENGLRVTEMRALRLQLRTIANDSRGRALARLREVAGVAGVAWAAEAAEAAWVAPGRVRQLIYDAAYKRGMELAAELNPKAFELLERMLPTEPLALPVASDAEAVCALS